ncbi:hypothetical protein amyaer_1566 [Microcystis aeruginosa NIES-2481]|nr:hypothetical protein amyaer_1566 [Microcystis aeruginosa NIES-2481]
MGDEAGKSIKIAVFGRIEFSSFFGSEHFCQVNFTILNIPYRQKKGLTELVNP